MHERREQADAYGYTERINCGVVTLNLFREDALHQNLPLDNNHVVDLGSATFPEHHLSPLHHSGIEILPGTDRCSAELFAYISFATSENWRGQQAFDTQLTALRKHFEETLRSTDVTFSRQGNSLIVHREGCHDTRISFTTLDHEMLCAEIYGTIDETQPHALVYEDIIVRAQLWGELHDFIVRSTNPHQPPLNTQRDTLYIGTTPSIPASDIELELASQLGERQLVHPHAPEIKWSKDILSVVIQEFQHSLPAHPDIAAAAEDIIRKKHEITVSFDSPVRITQSDIIRALAQHVKAPNNR